MNRREFCRQLTVLGGSVALGPLLKACAPDNAPPAAPAATQTASDPTAALPLTDGAAGEATASATKSPTPTEEASPTAAPTQEMQAAPLSGAVALIATTDRAEGVRRALRLLDVNPARGNRVLLKPNLNSADPSPGATHPDILRTLTETLLDMGARSITVGDRSGMGNTRAVMQQLGVYGLTDRLGLETLVFDELEAAEWVVRQSGDFHWQNGFAVPRALLDSECVVQTCNLKTHRYGGHFTMALKNSVGFAAKYAGNGHNYMHELHNSPYQREMIAEINTAYSPGLIVMDGVEAFVRGGPAQGEKAATQVILAATDPVAIDAVGVAILRLFGTTPEVSAGAVFDQAQIARAAELELGVRGPEEIVILSDDPAGASYAERIRAVLSS